MLKRILVPEYVRKGVGHNHTGFPERYVLWAADTETVNGEPDTLQICDGKTVHFFDEVNRDNILDTFLDYFKPLLLEHQVNIVYFHNLQFDISVLLMKYHELYLGRRKLHIEHKWQGDIVKIDAVVANCCFGSIKFPDGTSLRLLDSSLFVRGSLASVAQKLKLEHQKLPSPKGLGERRMRDKEFINYAINDAWVQYDLAKWIVAQHEHYRVRLCVSIAQFASRVFKHHYVRPWENIECPGMPIVQASVYSYHGGKNGYYVDGVTVVEDCVEVDITSAYPYAMRELPNFVGGYYRRSSWLEDGFEGVYRVTGEVKKCRYPILYDHAFKALPAGFVKDVWVTSYELREAIEVGEFEPEMERGKPKGVWGYVYVPDPEQKHNPLVEYVDYFFEKKDTAKSPEERVMYKLLLNSLYGKFIQAIEYEPKPGAIAHLTDEKKVKQEAAIAQAAADFEVNDAGLLVRKEKLYKAGGLFNPLMATLITAHTRRYLHRLEHKYKALHSSTDSVKMLGKHFDANPPPSKGLGGCDVVTRGKCVLFRNKLYLHYDEKRQLHKFALHGFTGSEYDLEDAFRRMDTHYRAKHMHKVREALRQRGKVKALTMTYVDKTLDVDFSRVTYIAKDGSSRVVEGRS